MKRCSDKIADFFELTGARFWTASLLPVVVGTTLPFWLDPPGFQFKLTGAVLFLLVILFGHAGFHLLYVAFTEKLKPGWSKKQLYIAGTFSLILSVLVGLYLNSTLELHRNVPEYIFIIYGIAMLFIGILYVAPPFSFYQHLFGEIIICVGLGMLPVLGAYLIQVGDITRTVYIASLPIVISTGLWLWIVELTNRSYDEKHGYKTTILYFSVKVSSRYITLLMSILIYAFLILAVWGRTSLNPVSLLALFSSPFAVIIMKKIWKDYENVMRLEKAEKFAFLMHLSLCLIIAVASLTPLVTQLSRR